MSPQCNNVSGLFMPHNYKKQKMVPALLRAGGSALSLGVGSLLGGESVPAERLGSSAGAHCFFCWNTQGTK